MAVQIICATLAAVALPAHARVGSPYTHASQQLQGINDEQDPASIAVRRYRRVRRRNVARQYGLPSFLQEPAGERGQQEAAADVTLDTLEQVGCSSALLDGHEV